MTVVERLGQLACDAAASITGRSLVIVRLAFNNP